MPCCSKTAQNAAVTRHAAESAITRGCSSRGSRTIQATHDATTSTASVAGTKGGSGSSHRIATMAAGTATMNAATPNHGVVVEAVGAGSIGSLSWFETYSAWPITMPTPAAANP